MPGRGRPSLYTEEIADEICSFLMDGLSMRQVCELDGMPSRATLIRWQRDNEDFDAKCARARVLQAELMEDLVMRTAHECTPETAHADKVKLAAYQWRAAKLNPRVYGDKLQHTGDGGGAVAVVMNVVTGVPRDADDKG